MGASSEGVRWGELKSQRADVAEAGLALLYQYGVGLAFLGTVRPDGGPRLHPICPLAYKDGLYAFVIPSPKRTDLVRDGRFALHSFAAEDNEDAFYVTGKAAPVDDRALRADMERQFRAERPTLDLPPSALSDHQLFELLIVTCMLTRTTGHGDPEPRHEVWRSSP